MRSPRPPPSRTPAIHLFHRIHPYPQIRDHPSFGRVHASDPDQGGVPRIQPAGSRCEPSHPGERLGTAAEERSHRHPVQVAGGGGFRGVRIRVGIHPQESETLLQRVAPRAMYASGHPGNRAERDRMIATEHHRKPALFPMTAHLAREMFNNTDDLPEIAGVRCARSGQRLGKRRLDVPGIQHLIAEAGETRRDPRPPYRRGSHVHSPAACSQIQRAHLSD